jgi:hypothetical protein
MALSLLRLFFHLFHLARNFFLPVQKANKAKADAFGLAVASGLICGDGIWTLPSSILALAGVSPPIYMKFLSSATNKKVTAFLNGS